MNKQKFTATELYCMCYVYGAESMYGVHNFIDEDMTEEDGNAWFKQELDSLYDQGVMNMNLDGKYSLNEAYEYIPEMVCECDKCLTMIHQQEDGSAVQNVFWKMDESIYRADVEEMDFTLIMSDAEDVRMRCFPQTHSEVHNEKTEMTLLTHLAIMQTQNAIDAQDDERAVRILRSNGASKCMSESILNALKHNADYISLTCMDNTSGKTEKSSVNKMVSCDSVFTLEDKLLGGRSAIAYIPASEADLNEEIHAAVENFLA